MSQPEQSHEIVIVRRRRGDDHDDHHGGVWKVAFADFMTAMMAFFLVLWIVNSTTKQTRSSLARYFNPIRLSDTTPARKGLNDPREVDFDASADGRIRDEKELESRADEALLDAAPSIKPLRDVGNHKDAGAGVATRKRDRDAGPARNALEHPFATDKNKLRLSNDAEKGGERSEPALSGSSVAKQLKLAVEARLGDDQASKLNGSLDVVEAPEGILISLTDKADVGAFGIGSSEPERRQLRILAAIAGALKDRSGSIVIRGHTDSRQYRGGDGFENWRLSFARAQSALLGLVGAGMDERRIERIEGHADRRPKNASSPQASENRRIEILLRWRAE